MQPNVDQIAQLIKMLERAQRDSVRSLGILGPSEPAGQKP